MPVAVAIYIFISYRSKSSKIIFHFKINYRLKKKNDLNYFEYLK